MFANDNFRRDEFYTDLVPLTNAVTTTTSVSGPDVTASKQYQVSSEIFNSLSGTTGESTNSDTNLLTDSATTSMFFTTLNSITIDTTTSTSAKKESQTSVSQTSTQQLQSSAFTNVANMKYTKKSKTIIFGLLGSSFLISLL